MGAQIRSVQQSTVAVQAIFTGLQAGTEQVPLLQVSPAQQFAFVVQDWPDGVQATVQTLLVQVNPVQQVGLFPPHAAPDVPQAGAEQRPLLQVVPAQQAGMPAPHTAPDGMQQLVPV